MSSPALRLLTAKVCRRLSGSLDFIRHRFATTVLNKWLDEKRNLSSRLPYLQTYMGHKDLAATAYYIHLLPEQLVKNSGIDWDSMNDLLPRCELWEK